MSDAQWKRRASGPPTPEKVDALGEYMRTTRPKFPEKKPSGHTVGGTISGTGEYVRLPDSSRATRRIVDESARRAERLAKRGTK